MSEQARADAMADAETLLRAYHMDFGNDCPAGVLMLDEYAEQVRLSIQHRDEHWAGECAERNARAAFRAVPGLRG